jgi:hypothetical protein
MKDKSIEITEEALKIVFFSEIINAENPSKIMNQISMLEGNGDLPTNIFKNLTNRLSVAMQTHTLGELLRLKMIKLNLNEDYFIEKSRLSGTTLNGIFNDQIQISNLPIVLFRKLVISAKLSYSEVEKAVWQTFYKLDTLHKFNNVDFIQTRFARKPTSFGLKEKFSFFVSEETEEALIRYLNRLKEEMS